MYKVACLATALLGLATASASAFGDYPNLSGRYVCVQNCRDGAVGSPAPVITQNGSQMNIVNEVGQPSRGWFDYSGRIWAPDYNEGAMISPDGMVLQFDHGTVWRRDIRPARVVAPPPLVTK